MDNISIIARTHEALNQVFLLLEAEVVKMHLNINQAKNKYIPYTKSKFKFEVIEFH